ncbi:MAG TPA: four-carbon acid sugar kinase family protein, partial [Anseongella sp.]|nr:four-carbon acid sugar kinase family protein [Anseongella sp.]
VLKPAFRALDRLDVAHIHYKVCSTFDSSPTTGSIGRAIDIGTEVFLPEFIPLLVAAPALGRYCLFGNLFARMGTGAKGPAYRLDRHPSMSRHPVTPAGESDLRLHLSQQTRKKTGLLDILQVSRSVPGARRALDALVSEGAEVVLFDALYEEQLHGIGEIIDAYAGKGKKLFSVGSSGIEMALGAFWTGQGLLRAVQSWGSPGKAAPLLVVSGSCSPVTRGQIARAVSLGFSEIVLDAGDVGKEDRVHAAVEKYAPRAAGLVREGRNVILHTGAEITGGPGAPRFFNVVLGRIARAVIAAVPLQRLVIAGGDTSGHAARELGIEAVEMLAPLTPGAPLCRAFAPGSPADRMEVNFKGGQVGGEDYFARVLEGTPDP